MDSQAQRTKVFVALSGGVDSSVAAALLQEQGYDVTGVFIHVWQPPFLECEWRQERLSAMRVCAHLRIPFREFNFAEEYKRDVVDYLIEEYRVGRTPNPDVMCNKKVKFGAFYTKAREMGADYIATGHYAQRSPVEVERPQADGVRLLAAQDGEKDQTYFLWTLPHDILVHTLFPIGHAQKSEVRRLAAERGLATATKKDSQGVCFLGKLDMRDFLKHYIPVQVGDVLDESGVVIGSHEGAWFYTIGQRHGFTVQARTPESGAYYVSEKDVERNTLTVLLESRFNAPGAASHKVAIEQVNWIRETPAAGARLCARIRHRGQLLPCRLLALTAEVAQVEFDTPLRSSSGQSLVLYCGEECLGGGVIA
jgi:tRNA-uridine 2-sulfurtransferase